METKPSLFFQFKIYEPHIIQNSFIANLQGYKISIAVVTSGNLTAYPVYKKKQAPKNTCT